EEALDERGLLRAADPSARSSEGLEQRVAKGLPDGEALHPLRAPLRADVLAGRAPDLFRVLLEEAPVQAIAEPVDEEVLQAALRAAREEPRVGVARGERHAVAQAELERRVEVGLERIVEELAAEVDAREPPAKEHDVRVRLACRPGVVELAPLALEGEPGGALFRLGRRGKGQHPQPPL